MSKFVIVCILCILHDVVVSWTLPGLAQRLKGATFSSGGVIGHLGFSRRNFGDSVRIWQQSCSARYVHNYGGMSNEGQEGYVPFYSHPYSPYGPAFPPVPAIPIIPSSMYHAPPIMSPPMIHRAPPFIPSPMNHAPPPMVHDICSFEIRRTNSLDHNLYYAQYLTTLLSNQYNTFTPMELNAILRVIPILPGNDRRTKALINVLCDRLERSPEGREFELRTLLPVGAVVRNVSPTDYTTHRFVEVMATKLKQSTTIRLNSTSISLGCAALLFLDPNEASTQRFVFSLAQQINTDYTTNHTDVNANMILPPTNVSFTNAVEIVRCCTVFDHLNPRHSSTQALLMAVAKKMPTIEQVSSFTNVENILPSHIRSALNGISRCFDAEHIHSHIQSAYRKMMDIVSEIALLATESQASSDPSETTRKNNYYSNFMMIHVARRGNQPDKFHEFHKQTKEIVKRMTSLLAQCKGHFDENGISRLCCGLQGIDPSDSDTHKLVQVITEKIKEAHISLSDTSLTLIMDGLHRLDCHEQSTQQLVAAIMDKIKQSWCGNHGISSLFHLFAIYWSIQYFIDGVSDIETNPALQPIRELLEHLDKWINLFNVTNETFHKDNPTSLFRILQLKISDNVISPNILNKLIHLNIKLLQKSLNSLPFTSEWTDDTLSNMSGVFKYLNSNDESTIELMKVIVNIIKQSTIFRFKSDISLLRAFQLLRVLPVTSGDDVRSDYGEFLIKTLNVSKIMVKHSGVMGRMLVEISRLSPQQQAAVLDMFIPIVEKSRFAIENADLLGSFDALQQLDMNVTSGKTYPNELVKLLITKFNEHYDQWRANTIVRGIGSMLHIKNKTLRSQYANAIATKSTRTKGYDISSISGAHIVCACEALATLKADDPSLQHLVQVLTDIVLLTDVTLSTDEIANALKSIHQLDLNIHMTETLTKLRDFITRNINKN